MIAIANSIMLQPFVIPTGIRVQVSFLSIHIIFARFLAKTRLFSIANHFSLNGSSAFPILLKNCLVNIVNSPQHINFHCYWSPIALLQSNARFDKWEVYWRMTILVSEFAIRSHYREEIKEEMENLDIFFGDCQKMAIFDRKNKICQNMQPYDRNIPYNALPPLPPSAEYYRDEKLYSLLTSASRKLAELKGIAAMLPNQSIFVNTIALREAKASSAIENIFTTDDELYKALAYQEDESIQGPAKEILHYREALWEGFNIIREEGGITVNSLIKIYQRVKQTYDGIRPYQAETVIKKRGWGSLIGETVYTPPRGKGVVEKMLADMIEFLNDDRRYPIDPLLKMAMAHYQFEAIHPFRDGNGRTGRILCILYLIEKGLLDMPILYLSSYIIQNKDDYSYALSGVTGTGNWKEWLTFMLTAVIQTADFTKYKIEQIRTLMEKLEQQILSHKHSLSKIDIDKLFEQPYIRPKNLICERIKSINTAKKYLSELESIGILAKSKIGKEYVWFNTELMDILSSEY